MFVQHSFIVRAFYKTRHVSTALVSLVSVLIYPLLIPELPPPSSVDFLTRHIMYVNNLYI
jgi:hypothetical protein